MIQRLFVLAFIAAIAASFVAAKGPSKIGAGLYIIKDAEESSPKVLLLQRSEDSGNPLAWGLPGGNAETAELKDLFATAVREGGEEIGSVPYIEDRLGSIRVDWGSGEDNWYTVFFVETRSAFGWEPVLNEEHVAFAWVNVTDVLTYDLHPIIGKLMTSSEYYTILNNVLSGNDHSPGN